MTGLAYDLVHRLTENHLTLASAESCTGGMIGATVTAIAGSSAAYMGGIISYDTSVKLSVLGVSPDTVAKYGVVSAETAAEMAVGARRTVGSDIAVSVTGVAGPGGGTDDTPVGTVCFGIASPRGTRAVRVNFSEADSRAEIRKNAVRTALTLVNDEINLLLGEQI